MSPKPVNLLTGLALLAYIALAQGVHAQQAAVKISTTRTVPANTFEIVNPPYPLGVQPWSPLSSNQLKRVSIILRSPAGIDARIWHTWTFDFQRLQGQADRVLQIIISEAPLGSCKVDRANELRETFTKFRNRIEGSPPGRPFEIVREDDLLNLALRATFFADSCARKSFPGAREAANSAKNTATDAYRLLSTDGYGFDDKSPGKWEIG